MWSFGEPFHRRQSLFGNMVLDAFCVGFSSLLGHSKRQEKPDDDLVPAP